MAARHNGHMRRSTYLLREQREPVTARPAATVLLLRDADVGLQVLMTRRSEQASFAPGAYVFPGGGVDVGDSSAMARFRPSQTAALRTAAMAAIRESFEELGVLLARRGDGAWATQADIDQLDRQAPFFEQCERLGLTPAADQVYMLAHWITDRDLPKRFDVPFLIAPMPPEQTPVADEAEQFEPQWVSPQQALAAHAAGTFFMIFPTIRTLEHMAQLPNVATAIAACESEQALFVSCPRAGIVNGAEQRFMEHETAFGELAMVCPDGALFHDLTWQHERPVPLAHHIQRLTAPNSGMMTGPGTNTYILGEPATGYAVIDAGPADDAHLDRIEAATHGDIRWLVCTHSHSDHSPGAIALQARLRARGHGVPLYGMASGPHALTNSHFVPDSELAHQQVLALTGVDANNHAISHSLRCLHTPGHAANHLCLLLEEDALLFSGDHILNGSTTVINPPDGNMNDYLQSLDLLADVCTAHGVEFILPAHGYVLCQASQVIAHLKAHRLKREAKVLAAMRAAPNGNDDDWVALAYADTPSALWPVAKRSMQAHIERIQALNMMR
jgi:recombination protein RecT